MKARRLQKNARNSPPQSRLVRNDKPTLEGLHNEILFLICEQTSGKDAKNLRLVSRRLSDFATPRVFKSLSIGTDQESLKEFTEIGGLKEVSFHARSLELRCYSQITNIHGCRSFHEWLWLFIHRPHSDLNSQERRDVVEQVLQSLGLAAETALRQFHVDALAYNEWYRWLFRTASGSKKLGELLRCFPRLTELTTSVYKAPSFGWKSLGGGEEPLAFVEIRSRIKNAFECPRGTVTNTSSACLLDVLEATGESMIPLRVLRGIGLEGEDWTRSMEPILSRPGVLSKIRSLDLKFELGEATSAVPGLSQLLPQAHNLEKLSLDLAKYNFLQDTVSLGTLLKGNPSFPKLRRLSLKALDSPGTVLKDFLERHASSLRTLRLSYIVLYDYLDETDGDATESSQLNLPENSPEYSWLQMIRFFSESLHLEKIEFSGDLSNGRNEIWRVENDLDDLPMDCLKFRIERYITEGGEFPTIPRKAQETDESCRPTYADGDGDESWWFEGW